MKKLPTVLITAAMIDDSMGRKLLQSMPESHGYELIHDSDKVVQLIVYGVDEITSEQERTLCIQNGVHSYTITSTRAGGTQ